ncbi:MAG: hypothetical protein HUU35_08465 [Armatimonadetes bacterium]|nr:hypothetical protein [Armatimonadota bacterium]
MEGRVRPFTWLRWLLLLPLVAGLAGAIMPPLQDYTFNDGERQVHLKVPKSWQIEGIEHGLRARKDPDNDLFGTALLGFYEFDRAPSPDSFLDQALATWGKQFSRFKVLSKSKPKDRARVRLATVSFSLYGFPCRGYAMAVVGEETGTLGFTYADTTRAKQLHLDDLVQLLVAGSYGAYPVRGEGDDDARQAIKQAFDQLYGDGNDDLAAILKELEDAEELDYDLLSVCATFQPALRNLKEFLAQYLTQRPRERVKELAVYCVPTHQFNAFALGKNDLGPGLLAFHARLTEAFAQLAQHYTSLRNRKLEPEELSRELTGYSAALAEAVLAGGDMPAAGAIDFANDTDLARYEKVFYSLIGLVMSHEMAHYYLQHSESFGAMATEAAPPDAFRVQQREVAADSAALAHLQAAADHNPDVWEGGAIHAFGFLATVDNVAKRLAGKPEEQPEYMRSHPLGQTRLDMASAALGPPSFDFRNDPWNRGSSLEHGDAGILVVGGDPVLRGDQRTFTHPTSQVDFTFPTGWVAEFDAEEGTLSLRREGGGNLPYAVYSCGGEYPNPKAVASEVINEMKKSAKGFKVTRDEALQSGHEKLKLHLTVAEGKFGAGHLALVAVGVKTPGMSHGLLLMTPANRLSTDLPDFESLLQHMGYPL